MNRRFTMMMALPLVVLMVATQASAQSSPFRFEDMSDELGLRQQLGDWHVAHAGAWGDVNGDGRPDLYLGAFAGRPVFHREQNPPIPNQLFLNTPEGFKRAPETSVRLADLHARSTAALFVDLDNDGDLDLVVSNHVSNDEHPGSKMFENTGDGRFREVTPDPWPWPEGFTARNIAAIDINSDGRLDLAFADGRYGDESNARLVVLHNMGDFTFENVASEFGFPANNTPGLGLATGDVNEDGKLDIFVANANRLFLSQPDGTYRQCTKCEFRQPLAGGEEPKTCGADLGDLNGDGKLDMVTVVHGQPTNFDVYVNPNEPDAAPLVNVTREAGLYGEFPKETRDGRRIKMGQVRILDFDNDGRNDIATGLLYRDQNDVLQPVVLRNLGNRDGVPQFTEVPMDRLASYYSVAPMTDYDRDGRIDIMMPRWFDYEPNALMRNVTEDVGHYVDVTVSGDGETLNPMGVGATVRVYEAGKAGDESALLGRADMTLGNGYSSGSEARLHFGLGERTACDIVVTWRGQSKQQQNVEAGQTVNFGPFSK